MPILSSLESGKDFLVHRFWAAFADKGPVKPSTQEWGDVNKGFAKADAVANSVVKVFSTVRYPELYKPWTKQRRAR
jgi:hypothetical protein